MARFVVDEEPTKEAPRFQVEDDAPATTRFQVEDEGPAFPAGSPSARTPKVVKDAPSFDESFPKTEGKSNLFSRVEEIANTVVGSVVKPIEYVGEKYEKYVGGPMRRLAFKEDPLVTLDRRHQERQAALEATGASEGQKLKEDITHGIRSFGVQVLTDPLAAIGLRAGVGRRSASRVEPEVSTAAPEPIWQGPPKQDWQGPVQQVWQGPDLNLKNNSVDLSTLNKPKPTSPLPTISELADAQRYESTTPPGAFSEGMLTKPMRRSPESAEEHGAKDTRQVRVQRYVVDPESKLVVPFEHTKAGDTAFPTYEEITRLGEPPYLSRNRTDAEREMIGRLDPYNREFTTEFEKPGFLRTAEEKVQDKNPLRTAEEQVASKEPKLARDYEQTRRELIAAEEERMAARQRTKERLASERDEMMKAQEEAAKAKPVEQRWQGPNEQYQGPRAPVLYESPEQAGFSHDINGDIVISDGAFPGAGRRFTTRALDTLGETGETGTALKSLYYGMDDFARQSTAKNFADWVRQLQTIYPKNTRPGFLRDPRREWSYRDYANIPEKEYEVLVDLWYTNGTELTRYSQLSKDAQIRVDSAFKLWETATGRASSDPGVRRLTIRNSITGETTPMGEPTAFIPHQYRTGADTGKFSRTMMQRMYDQYRKNNAAPMSFNDFRETYVKRAAGFEQQAGQDGKMRWVRSPAERRFLGVEEARLFDAAAVAKEENKSILKVLQEHGLETDIAKLQLRYNLGAYHRGQLKLNEDKIAQLHANWRQEVDFDPDAVSWLDTLDARYKGLGLHEDIERLNATWLQQVKSYNSLTLLSRATLGAANQFFTYGLSKPTWGGLIDRAVARIRDPRELERVTELIPDSGALLSNFVQEMNRVDGFIGAASMAQLRLTGFNYLDRVQRVGAAKIGYFYARDLGKKLMRDPMDSAVKYQLQELRLNPDEVLSSMQTTGTLNDALAKRAMQTYADMSMGTTGVRGRPLWATGDSALHQLTLNIRGQLVSNMAEARRMIFEAPDFMTGVDRATRLLLGSALAGSATMAIRDAITGHYGELRGSAKDIAKKIGNEAVARTVDGIMYGLGTTATDATIMLVAPGDDVGRRFTTGIIGVPATQLYKAADFYTGIKKDPGRTILRNIPSPVPLDMLAEEAGVIRKKPKK